MPVAFYLRNAIKLRYFAAFYDEELSRATIPQISPLSNSLIAGGAIFIWMTFPSTLILFLSAWEVSEIYVQWPSDVLAVVNQNWGGPL